MALKIMFVGHEQETLKSVRSKLQPLGHEILTLGDSHEAAQRAEKHQYHLFFLDMEMPDLDGFELLRRILKSDLNSDATTVMITPTDDIPVMRKAFSEGATFCLHKDVLLSRLVPLVSAMDSLTWEFKLHAARLPIFTPVTCTVGGQSATVSSANISETGILVEPTIESEVGQEIELEFTIREIGVSLKVRGRIVRKEGKHRMGVKFVALETEQQNAIQLYILGRLRDSVPPRRAPRTGKGITEIEMMM